MGSANSETNYSSDESIGSCEGNASNVDPNIYFGNLGLQYFVGEPLRMLATFADLKNECLYTGNPMAHYIEGILQYFFHKNTNKGLDHLMQSANGNFDTGTYIYGILMLCRGDFGEGIQYLDRLYWKTDQDRTTKCLTMVKLSLKEIRVTVQMRYATNIATITPPPECDDHDMENACEECYYFKRASEFLDYIREKNKKN